MRAFLYVNDLTELLERAATHPAAIGQVFNLGNSEEISIAALAERVKAMTGSASPIVRIPSDEAYEAGFEDIPRRVPNLTKARALVGYTPTIDLGEILHRCRDTALSLDLKPELIDQALVQWVYDVAPQPRLDDQLDHPGEI